MLLLWDLIVPGFNATKTQLTVPTILQGTPETVSRSLMDWWDLRS